MKRSRAVRLSLPRCLLGLLVLAACEPPPDFEAPGPLPELETEAVLATVRGFHTALERGDSAEALRLLHADAVIHEAGTAETLEEYRGHHLPADVEFAGAVRRRVVSERVVPLGTDAALYLATSTAEGEFRGREIRAPGAESMVLVRTPQGWRIQHVHWSSR